MRLTVEFYDGVYSFRVESLEPTDDYVEVISGLSEKDTYETDDDFAGLFDKDEAE